MSSPTVLFILKQILERLNRDELPTPNQLGGAIDANPVTVAYAQRTLKARLPSRLAARIRVETADALALPYADRAFDMAIGAMFLHHFAHERAGGANFRCVSGRLGRGFMRSATRCWGLDRSSHARSSYFNVRLS